MSCSTTSYVAIKPQCGRSTSGSTSDPCSKRSPARRPCRRQLSTSGSRPSASPSAERTRTAFEELTTGLTRSSRLMQQMLPLLLEWLSASPDPDLGLLGLRTLAGTSHRQRALDHHLPRVAGGGPTTVPVARHQPVVHRRAGSQPAADHRAGRRSRPRGADGARRCGRCSATSATRNCAIAVRDVLGQSSVESAGSGPDDVGRIGPRSGARRTGAAAARCRLSPWGALVAASCPTPATSTSSSCTTEPPPRTSPAPNGSPQQLLQSVKGTTPASRVYFLDADLRPEGKQGPLARSLEGYRAYYERYAQTWERQALVRARPVAGDAELGGRFMAVVEEFVWGRPFTGDGRARRAPHEGANRA